MSNEPFGRFFYMAEKDKAASREQGREVYVQVPYISVTHPGRKDYELITQATDELKKQFPKAWEAFKDAEKEPENGTPLKMVPIMSVDAIATLNSMGIETLEGFAGVDQDELKTFPAEIVDLHKKAMLYLEAATDKGALAGKFAKAQNEIEALKADLGEARDTIAELKKENETLTKLVDGKTAPVKKAS